MSHLERFMLWAGAVLLSLVITACSRKDPGSSTDASPSASAPAAIGSAAPAAVSLKDVLARTDPAVAPLIELSMLEAWQHIDDERARDPEDGQFRPGTWTYFGKACPALKDKSLVEKDEFDRARARTAQKKARLECLDQLTKKLGARPKVARLQVPIKRSYLAWTPGPDGYFGLELSGDIYTGSSDSKRRLLELDYDLSSCGGPGVLAVTLPGESAVRIGGTSTPRIVVSVDDVERAKAMKATLVGAKRLAVELLVDLKGPGGLGRMCRIQTPSRWFEREAGGTLASLLALRVVDGDAPITAWTPGDIARVPEDNVLVGTSGGARTVVSQPSQPGTTSAPVVPKAAPTAVKTTTEASPHSMPTDLPAGPATTGVGPTPPRGTAFLTPRTDMKPCCAALAVLSKKHPQPNVMNVASACPALVAGGYGGEIRSMVDNNLSCRGIPAPCEQVPMPAECR